MTFFAKATDTKSEIWLYDTIGADYYGEGVTAKSVSDALKSFKPKSDLDIFVNSPGGSVFEGMAIFNQLSRWQGKKNVYIDGLAASIASVIAMVGDEITIASNGLFMIHSAWGLTVGNADEMRKYAENLDKVDGTILDTYVARTKGDSKEIDKWMRAETWMNAQEAIERGFATKKSGANASMKAEFPLLAKFKNTPQQLRTGATDPKLALARMQMRTANLKRRPAGATA